MNVRATLPRLSFQLRSLWTGLSRPGMLLPRAVGLASVVALASGCTSAGASDCGRDADCAAGERCVIGLCTPMPASTDTGAGSSAVATTSAGPADSGAQSRSSESGTGAPGPPPSSASSTEEPESAGRSGTDERTGDPPSTEVGTGGGAAPSSAAQGSGSGEAPPPSSGAGGTTGSGGLPGPGTSDVGSGGEPSSSSGPPPSAGTGTGTAVGTPSGSEEPGTSALCAEAPTGAAACLLELPYDGDELSDEPPTVVCPALRPFCGEEVWTTPLGAIARCTDESVSRNATFRTAPEVAAVFRDERTCDGEDTNCDGRVDEQCCHVLDEEPTPIALAGSCLGSFEQGVLPGWPAPADREALVQRVLVDLRVRDGALEAIWYRVMPSAVELVVDRVHPRSGAPLSRRAVALPQSVRPNASWIAWGDDLFVVAADPEHGVGVHRVRIAGDAAPAITPMSLDPPLGEVLAVSASVLSQSGRADELLLLMVGMESDALQVSRQRLQVLDSVLEAAGGAQTLSLQHDGLPYTPALLVEDPVLIAGFTAEGSGVVSAWCWQEDDPEEGTATACFHADAPLSGPAEAMVVYRGPGVPAASAMGPTARRPARWGMVTVDSTGQQTLLRLDLDTDPPTVVALDVVPDTGGGVPHWLERGGSPLLWFTDNGAGRSRLADGGSGDANDLADALAQATTEQTRTVLGALTPVATLVYDDTEWVLATRDAFDGPCAASGSVEAWLVPFARSGERLCLAQE